MPQDLLRVELARPCSVSWESMSGDDQVRFCSLCQKCVYNFSAMPLEKVQRLVREREGKICARFFQREDGTVMTADCGFGVERVRRFAGRLRWAAIGLALSIGGGWFGTWFINESRRCEIDALREQRAQRSAARQGVHMGSIANFAPYTTQS